MKTINECFENPNTNGIFYYMDNMNVPWRGLNLQLDFMYHLSHSGNKFASRFLKSLCDSDTGYITEYNASTLVNSLYQIYKYKWSTLWQTMNFEYDPITNYDMEEDETISASTSNTSENISTNSGTDYTAINISHVHSGTDTAGRGGTEATTKNGSDNIRHSGNVTLHHGGTTVTDGITTEDKTGTDTRDIVVDATETPNTTITDNGNNYNSVYGFNSSESVGKTIDSLGNTRTTTGYTDNDSTTTDTIQYNSTIETSTENTVTHDLEDTTTYNNTDTTTYASGNTTTYNTTDTTTYNSTLADHGSNAITYGLSNSTNITNESEDNTTRSLTRKGNIGVMTTQQMIMQEREIAVLNYFEIVFNDIDTYLALKIY